MKFKIDLVLDGLLAATIIFLAVLIWLVMFDFWGTDEHWVNRLIDNLSGVVALTLALGFLCSSFLRWIKRT
ncbi:MAG: hypothetical protein IPN69_09775 [Acidobacteria bacterium]|nr:hypothetical protein [Acidobacteriota bacterium]